MSSTTSVPLVGICFEVLSGSKSLGVFSECSGLQIEIATEDFKEGGNSTFVWKLPTQVSQPNLVLKRGVTSATDLADWIKGFSDSTRVKPKNVQINLLDRPGGTAARSWIATKAYPVKWDGPTLNATKGDVVFESIELAHQGLTEKVSK